ncbi:choice-of-anchor A family protein [Verrucomicrobiaceae bacterium R5-34]|nr:choice-of-anchor A family protein [Verrucomicrobiaceae bacterium R5-34]
MNLIQKINLRGAALGLSSLSLAAALPLSVTDANAQSLSPLSDYSVIVSGDFSTTSDVEGRTLVGGDLTGSNSMNLAIKLQNTVDSSTFTLQVAGDIVSGNSINLNAGSIELGGSISRNVNYNGGGSLVSNPGVSYDAIFAQLDAASSQLSGLASNSVASFPSSQPGPLVFSATPDDDGTAIFSYSGNDIFSNNYVQQIELDLNSASTVVINVSGTDIDWTSGNMVGSFTDLAVRESVIWNFYEAESIDFGSYNMMGQVLAPNATVTTSANIDGSIYAQNLTTTSEVHLPTYNGELVPEPSSLAMLGLSAFAFLMRRKRG